jgi:hypothetical protein
MRLELQNIDLEDIPTPTAYKMHDILKLAKQVSEDLAASVPFHLVRNPEVFVATPHQQQSSNGRQEAIVPNISVGGLLLMHVILIASTTSMIPQQISQSFREYLVWIGRVMGIGQAEVVSDVSFQFMGLFVC